VPTAPSTEPNAGTIYGELIEKLITEEGGRKASFEQRGITVITSSGVFVSLVFGIGAVATSQHFSVSASVRTVLSVAVAAFALAAVAGIVANWPMKYQDLTLEQLEKWVTPTLWEKRADPAARRAAEARVNVLRRARGRNARKARALITAMVLQVIAIGLVAAAVVLIAVGA